MNKYLSSGLALSVILALSGCGGGGDSGSTSSTSTTTSTTTSGTASDGYISGGTVCLDMNKNDLCDKKTEPFTLTNADGSYSLTITAVQKAAAQPNAPLLIKGGIDVDTNAPLIGALKAPFSGDTTVNTVLTPLTTLVSAMVEKNVPVDTAYTKVAAALGIPADKVKADPVQLAKDGDPEVLAAAMATHRIIQTMAAVDDQTDSDAIYEKLTDAIEQIAAADTNTTKGIAAVVETAANDANSTLPQSVKEAAKVATVIETQVTSLVTTAVENNTSIEDAALRADAAVETVQTLVITAIENNTTIDDDFVEDVDANATATADAINPIQLAVENVFTAYGMTTIAEDNNITSTVASHFSASSDVTVESIIALSDTLGNPTYIEGDSTSDGLRHYYRTKLVTQYIESRGYTFSDPHIPDYIAELKNTDGAYAFSESMSVADFATMIYNEGVENDIAELMTLALKMSPPADLASLTDVEKAKSLFDSLRTQVNSVANSSLTGYADTESVKINDALENTAMNIEYVTKILDFMNEGISVAMETNQTTISTQLPADRGISLSLDTDSNNITWAYDINQSDGTHWRGTFTYPNEDYENFDPSTFDPLHAVLAGDLPLDEEPVTKDGVEDKQSVNVDASITKTATGADFSLSASIASNGDSIAITDAKASVAYTTITNDDGEKEPMPTYVQLHNLYVNGTMGNYTLDGKLDVNAYTQNSIMAAAGGAEIEIAQSWANLSVTCHNSNIIINTDSDSNQYQITYNGTTYYPIQYDIYTYNAYFSYEINEGNIDESLIDYSYEATCADENDTVDHYFYFHTWTDNEPNNSGYLPADLTFDGKIANSADNSYFEGKVSAKWLDIADANLSDDEYTPKLQVSMNGKLQMPESPLMSVSIAYDNSDGNVIDTTYVYDTLSVTSHNVLDATLDNGTINITASTGIKATLKLVNDEIDYANSTLTTTDGKTLGTFRDMSGVPTILYIDGTFESLP